MAGLLPGEPGGIFRLIDLPAEHWEAIQADLIQVGRTLDDIPHRFDWCAVLAIVKHPREDSALYRQIRRDQVGAQADWPMDRHIAVLTMDELRLANWQRVAQSYVRAGKTPPDPPEPTPRPGVSVTSVVDESLRAHNGVIKATGGKPVPAADFKRWWRMSQAERDAYEEAA